MVLLKDRDVFVVTTVDLYSFATTIYITRMNEYIGLGYVGFEIPYVVS